MTIDKVPLWLVDRGVGHAVADVRGDYSLLACRPWSNFVGSTMQIERPTGKCGKGAVAFRRLGDCRRWS